MSKIKFVLLDSIVKKLPFSSLLRDTSGVAWDRAENDLLNYNKTILTISSSALVLSFSVIKITGVHISSLLLGISWLLLAVSLLAGACILFMKFIASLSDGILFAHDGKKIKKEKILELQTIYFICLTCVYYFGALELIAFISGLLLLIGTVFASLK